MSRQRKITVRALNLRLHRHSAASYTSLFDQIFDLRQAIQVRNDQYIIVSSIQSAAHKTQIAGVLSRFTKIESGDWFDVDKLDAADPKSLKEIHIPQNLRPNHASFYFLFDIKSHIVAYEHYAGGKILTNSQVLSYFEGVLALPKIANEFGQGEVSIIASRDAIPYVFGLKEIRRLSILVKRPNPDDLAHLEKEIAERLKKQGAASLEETLVAEKGKGLTPDEFTTNQALVAARNGEVVSKGRDDRGMNVKRSTSDHPLQHEEKYDPETQSEKSAFEAIADTVLKKALPYI